MLHKYSSHLGMRCKKKFELQVHPTRGTQIYDFPHLKAHLGGSVGLQRLWWLTPLGDVLLLEGAVEIGSYINDGFKI
jgi:hypothetical protein